MGIGWVVFEKIFEDEHCIEYKYCHDSFEMDGTIKIMKESSYNVETGSIFEKFSDEEKSEIFRVVLEELNEEPKVNKELWQEYQKRLDENDRSYEEWLQKSVAEVNLSVTDSKKGFFANKVIHFIYRICCEDTWDFPEKKTLAY